MVSISIEAFINLYRKNNPEVNSNQLRVNLKQAVRDKKNGETCFNCGQEIWAIGSAIVYQGCYSCITGEADSSADYEINDVCWS